MKLTTFVPYWPGDIDYLDKVLFHREFFDCQFKRLPEYVQELIEDSARCVNIAEVVAEEHIEDIEENLRRVIPGVSLKFSRLNWSKEELEALLDVDDEAFTAFCKEHEQEIVNALNDSGIKHQYYSRDEWIEHTGNWTFQNMTTSEILEEIEIILMFMLDSLDYTDKIDDICADFPLEDFSNFRETAELQKLVWDIHELEEYGDSEFWKWSKNIALPVDRKKIMHEMQMEVIQRRTEQLIEEYERSN